MGREYYSWIVLFVCCVDHVHCLISISLDFQVLIINRYILITFWGMIFEKPHLTTATKDTVAKLVLTCKVM